METRDIDSRLWDYIDGNINTPERSNIENLWAADADLKSRYQELLELHQMVQSNQLDSPSMRFGKNVMEKIASLHIAPAARTYINKKIIWAISFFFIALVVGFLVYGFGSVTWSGGESTTISQKISNFNISKLFSNTWVNAFMMINVILGLFLLDNFLTRKRKEYKK